MIEKKVILYVDDEKENLSSFKFLFRRDYKIVLSESGKEALEEFDKNVDTFEAVISDHKMPGITGVEFLTKIREINPNVTRVILSGYIEVDEAERAIEEGIAHEYVKKPFNPDEIRTIINKYNN